MPYLTREDTGDESISCKVLTAALDLFVENGYHNVSIHDIQKRASVSIGSIYNHFGGKEGVAKGLYDHLVMELERVLDDIQEELDSPRGQCQAIIERLFGYTETHRNIIAFIFNARHREILENTPTICSSAPFIRMRDMVSAAMQAGEFRTMTPLVAASLVFGSAIRMIQLRLDGLVEVPLPTLQSELFESIWLSVDADATTSPAALEAVAAG